MHKHYVQFANCRHDADCSALQDGCKLPHSIMHRGRDGHAGGSQRLSRAATGKERRGFVQGDGCQAGGRDNALRKAEALSDLAVPVQDCDLTIRILLSGPPRHSLSDLELEQALTVRLDFMTLCGSSVAERPGSPDGLPVSPVACAASGRDRGWGGDHVPGRPGASAIICGNGQTPGRLRKPECRAKNRFRKVLRHATIGHEGI